MDSRSVHDHDRDPSCCCFLLLLVVVVVVVVLLLLLLLLLLFYISSFFSVFFFASFFFHHYYYQSIYRLSPEEDNFLLKALVFHCFFVFCRIGEYNISLDLFYFVNLTSSCSFIPHDSDTFITAL